MRAHQTADRAQKEVPAVGKKPELGFPVHWEKGDIGDTGRLAVGKEVTMATSLVLLWRSTLSRGGFGGNPPSVGEEVLLIAAPPNTWHTRMPGGMDLGHSYSPSPELLPWLP